MNAIQLVVAMFFGLGCASAEDSGEVTGSSAEEKRLDGLGLSSTHDEPVSSSEQEPTDDRVGSCGDAFAQCVSGCGQMNDPCQSACQCARYCCLGAPENCSF